MNFTSWQTVKVTDESLESHGRAGSVRSASEYDKKEGKTTRSVVDVQLDGDTELTVFGADQVEAV